MKFTRTWGIYNAYSKNTGFWDVIKLDSGKWELTHASRLSTRFLHTHGEFKTLKEAQAAADRFARNCKH